MEKHSFEIPSLNSFVLLHQSHLPLGIVGLEKRVQLFKDQVFGLLGVQERLVLWQVPIANNVKLHSFTIFHKFSFTIFN